MGDSIQSLVIFLAVIAFTAAIFPQLLMTLHSKKQQPSGGLTPAQFEELKKGFVSRAEFDSLKKEFNLLVDEMKALNDDYNDLSSWSVEQFSLISDGSTVNDSNDQFFPADTQFSDETLGADAESVATDKEVFGLSKNPAGKYDESRKSNVYTRGNEYQNTFSTPRRPGLMRLFTRQFDRRTDDLLEKMDLFPQQKEPVGRILEDAKSQMEQELKALQEKGVYRGADYIKVRNAQRKRLEDELSQVLTTEQMDTYNSLYENSRSRYRPSSGRSSSGSTQTSTASSSGS